MRRTSNAWIELEVAPKLLEALRAGPLQMWQIKAALDVSGPSVHRAVRYLRGYGVEIDYHRATNAWEWRPAYDAGHRAQLDSVDLEDLIARGIVSEAWAKMALELVNRTRSVRSLQRGRR